MFCVFQNVERDTIRCERCGQTITAEGISAGLVAVCDSRHAPVQYFDKKRRPTVEKSMQEILAATYEELSRLILGFLAEQGPATADRVQRFLGGCQRAPGVLAGMVAQNRLAINTAVVQNNSLYSLLEKRS